MKDGKPGEQEDRRVEHIIPADAVKKGSYTVYIEVTANGMFGLGPYRYQTPDVSFLFPERTDIAHPLTQLSSQIGGSRSSLPTSWYPI